MTNAQPTPTGCCPLFDPAPWRDREITWSNKLFLKDHVRSFLHIPLNMNQRMKVNMARIEAAQAKPDQGLMLSDEHSLWGSDIYISVTKDVPQANMTTLSGTFLTRVYEGPYSKISVWAKDMKGFVTSRGKTLKKLYFAYTTCPGCAKVYGKNYVVLFAQI